MMIVNFEIKGGEVIREIEMSTTSTILELKRSIECEMLKDVETIAHYGFHSAVGVHLMIMPKPEKEFFVVLKSLRPVANVKVKETNTVFDLKMKIQKLWGIETKNITLFRLFKEMEDDILLCAYYVYEGLEVEVEIAINKLLEIILLTS
ncbi:hypothetical protein PVL29_010076 [Vitis rotundifolia]|uniref:Ubiquitin-like domain-containing protein n=1 Tax=Vitis rotundifolia TaxID=103349 RepID=A0AA38ZSG6_VITRO|nr:hypothetical protein PVL29_010076 [Vitis rotundifolia]